jgi:hypothetical protein
MLVMRCILALACLGVALFCAWEAYLIHLWNTAPNQWLFSDTLQVFGATKSRNASVAGLELFAVLFLCFAGYVFFASRSNN